MKIIRGKSEGTVLSVGSPEFDYWGCQRPYVLVLSVNQIGLCQSLAVTMGAGGLEIVPPV